MRDGALIKIGRVALLERETRIELATLCLGSRCSTTELLPLGGIDLWYVFLTCFVKVKRNSEEKRVNKGYSTTE